jgi:hypothetical protein
MKSYSFTKALTLVSLVGLSLPIACGDDDDDMAGTAGTAGASGTTGTAGTAGKGGTAAAGAGAGGDPGTAGTGGTTMLPPGLSDMPSTESCGADTCNSAVAGPSVYVDACCTGAEACGLDTGFLSLVGASFKEVCQALAQPGDLDDSCQAATGLTVPFQVGANTLMVPLDPFPGCCREDGTCGVVVDDVTSGNGKLPIGQFGLGCVDAAPFFGKAAACGGAIGGSGGAGAGGDGGGGGDGGATLVPVEAGGQGGAGGVTL